MKKILALALFAVALVSCRQTMQTDGFKLSGHLEGLQVGDTLFLKTFLLPDWKEDGTDTILVEKEGIFSAFIPMEHTTFYLLTHQPKVGEPLRSCIRGAEIIARVGDDYKTGKGLWITWVRFVIRVVFMTIRWWLGMIA